MKDTKRQNLPAASGLWVVATPIGNLQDLTPRAKRALEVAEVILCEDTRRTSKLLSATGIHAALERLDAHATEAQLRRQVERLQKGVSMALVTDAGTPGISDPAAELVRMAREAGIVVTPVPGASAVVALLSVAGFSETAFVFRGFFPRKQSERRHELEEAKSFLLARVFVWFESPERIVDSLELLREIIPECRIVVGKELTKVHERIWDGEITSVFEQVRAEVESEGAIGEWCFAVLFPSSVKTHPESSEWVKALQCMIDAKVPVSEAARRISQTFGIPRKAVYDLALKFFSKKCGEGG